MILLRTMNNKLDHKISPTYFVVFFFFSFSLCEFIIELFFSFTLFLLFENNSFLYLIITQQTKCIIVFENSILPFTQSKTEWITNEYDFQQ